MVLKFKNIIYTMLKKKDREILKVIQREMLTDLKGATIHG
jgi:hypothetical protein